MLELDKKFKGRAWVFTIFKNEETHVCLDKIQARLNKRGQKKSVVYLISGREICPKTGRHHLQGAVYFKNGKTRDEFQSWTCGRKPKHWCDIWRGTAEQNKKYCSKDRKYIEHGSIDNIFNQGKRNDISIVKEALEEGANMRTIIKSATNNQVVQFAAKYLTYHEKQRKWKPEVLWFWGPAGTGKTRKAWELAPDAYCCNETTKWWDGYDAHEEVIIDDITEDFSTFKNMLKIIDRYPYQVQVKGGYRQLLVKRIIITGTQHPSYVWGGGLLENNHWAQLSRRIDKIVEFKHPVYGPLKNPQK